MERDASGSAVVFPLDTGGFFQGNRIQTSSHGSGHAGDIAVRAELVVVDGLMTVDSVTFSDAPGASIALSADSIRIVNDQLAEGRGPDEVLARGLPEYSDWGPSGWFISEERWLQTLLTDAARAE